MKSEKLVLESVKNSAQTDQLRSTVYALRRFNEWARFRHGSGHGFNLPDSYVAWFLRENLVNSDHVSQSLVAGLRFASDKLMFPFSVSSSSLRALAKAPTKTPKQAPSASVRVVHHFWEVACNESYSVPLRGVAAIFLVRCPVQPRGCACAASMPTICQKKAGACDVPDFCGFSAPSSCVMESPPLSRGSLSRIRGRKVGTRNKSKGVPNSPHEQRQSELGAAAARRERALQGVAGASRQAACTLRVGSHSRTGYRMRVWQANPN